MTRKAEPAILAAIDLGASKASCLIARLGEDGALTPLGVGRQTMRRGADAVGADSDGAARLLAMAFDNAVRMAGATPQAAILAYAGAGLTSVAVQASIPIAAAGVNERNLEQASLAMVRSASRKGAAVMRLLDVSYRVDAGPPLTAPLGLKGQTLHAEAIAATAPQAGVDFAESLCAKAGLFVAAMAPAPLAAAEAVLTAAERADGVIVVDMGAAHTGIAVWSEGAPAHVESIAAGGDHLTAKIAAELGTTLAAAERVKIAHADLTGGLDPRHVVELALIGADGRLSPGVVLRGSLDIAARTACMDGLAQLQVRLDAIDPAARLPVALTGGAAQLPGLGALAERALGRPVRIASPIGFGVIDAAEGGPGFAAAAGALRVLSADLIAPQGAGFDAQSPNLPAKVGKAWAWLRENL